MSTDQISSTADTPVIAPVTQGTTTRAISPDQERLAHGRTLRPASETDALFHLLTPSEILDLPEASWLIEGLLPTGALTVLFGQPGAGKSFVALDWGLSIASGRPWQNRGVRGGSVAYVAAEGVRGMGPRIAAWRQHFAVQDLGRARFIAHPVQLLRSEQIDRLIQTLEAARFAPSLIVFDTLARCFIGGDENTAKEVGLLIDSCRRLQAATAAAIVLVHHTGKAGDQERGSSALRAAADSMVKVSAGARGLVVIANDKQKEDEPSRPLRLKLESVPIPESDVRSCVLVPAPDRSASSEQSEQHRNALAALQACTGGRARLGDWRTQYRARFGDVPETTLRRYRDQLSDLGLVVQDGREWVIAVTGTRATTMEMPNSDGAATATPQRGGGVARGEA